MDNQYVSVFHIREISSQSDQQQKTTYLKVVSVMNSSALYGPDAVLGTGNLSLNNAWYLPSRR